MMNNNIVVTRGIQSKHDFFIFYNTPKILIFSVKANKQELVRKASIHCQVPTGDRMFISEFCPA